IVALSKKLVKTLFGRFEDVLRISGEGEAIRRYSSGFGFEGLGGASMILSRKGLDGVSFEEGVFDGAFSGDGEEDFVMGEGVVVSSSSLDMFTKSCLGGMMVSLILLEGLGEEAWVESMQVKEKWRR
ncbi:hypothetical protein Tco_1186573, partial [Tanacetum coccineum]